MSLQATVVEDWKSALKNKDPKKDALSMIITELKNRAIKENLSTEGGRVVSDSSAQEVLQKMAKQRREAIEAYNAADRPELAEKEAFELSVIEKYLPKQLDEQELQSIVSQSIQTVQATSMKDMGKVMGMAIKLCEGRADGKRVQAMVQSLLGGK